MRKNKKPKYVKITENDVVNIILRTAEDWQGCGIISPSNIAYLLKTSRYQVNSHIKSLKNKDLVVYKTISLNNGEDNYPPYHGYCLSKKGKEVYAKELKELSDLECELIKKCFGT